MFSNPIDKRVTILSKIYKALEKARKDRESDPAKGLTVLPGVEEEEPEQREKTPRVIQAPQPLQAPRLSGVMADQKLVTFYDPGSMAAEQFRKLRTQLLRLRHGQPPRTIMVTSATSGEGKSLVSANLAAGIAYEFQAYSLLLDCDLRAPSMGRLFGLPNGDGLADYLIGKKEIPELLHRTEVERLKVMLGGTIQDNPAELIGSERMRALIQELKARYSDRYIILDSTPLLSTAEPEVLSKLVDGILIVVRAGVTQRETLKQAISSLEKEKVLGFVLNDLQFRSSGLISRYFGADGYSYGYGYGYGYGKGRKESKRVK